MTGPVTSLTNLYTQLQAAVASLNKFSATFPRSGGNVWPINNLNSAGFVPVLPANPNRNVITFHNPGPNAVFVAPTTVGSSQAVFNPTPSLTGGCFVLVPGAWVTLAGTVQQGWQALAQSGSSQPLTIMDQ